MKKTDKQKEKQDKGHQKWDQEHSEGVAKPQQVQKPEKKEFKHY